MFAIPFMKLVVQEAEAFGLDPDALRRCNADDTTRRLRHDRPARPARFEDGRPGAEIGLDAQAQVITMP